MLPCPNLTRFTACELLCSLDRFVRGIDCRGQPGAEMAFVQVAAGVFQMRASQVMAPLVEEGQGHVGPSKSREIGKTKLPVYNHTILYDSITSELHKHAML